MLKQISSVVALKNTISELKNTNKRIGFVPTMGALHQGHISLIQKARDENEIVVCSIFINPLQFNDRSDYVNYPVTINEDIAMLEKSGCDILFLPSEKEMYPTQVTESYNFGSLEAVMEGAFRPGHFNGVAVVVKRLFDYVLPDKAYFGEKDYQQLLIIKSLVSKYNLPIEIIPCPIIRENDGLAMSSRNMRLSAEERSIAPFIFQTLSKLPELKLSLSVEEMKNWVEAQFHQIPFFKLDYFEVSDSETLLPLNNWSDSAKPHAFIAVFLGKIRLIDNMKLF